MPEQGKEKKPKDRANYFRQPLEGVEIISEGEEEEEKKPVEDKPKQD